MGSISAGVNLPLIAGMIGLLLTVRRMDKDRTLARGFYIMAVTILGFVGGFLVTPYSEPIIPWIQEVLVSAIIHAGAASILYQQGKLMLPSEDHFRFKNDTTKHDS